MYKKILMTLANIGNPYNSWTLKDSKFNFTPPWPNQRVLNDGSCYYCNAPTVQPILYLNNPHYPLCRNCCAPYIDSLTPVQNIPSLKLCSTRVPKGYISSYPLFRQISTVSAISTAFATLCLFLRGGNVWAVSFIIGGLSTVSSLTAYIGSRRFVPACIPYNSVAAALRALNRTPDLLASIIPDVGQRYNLYNTIKLLTQVRSINNDPAILELQKIETLCQVPLTQVPLQELLLFLVKESSGILNATLNEISQAVSETVELVLNENSTKEDLSILFAVLALAKKPISLTITATTTKPFSLADFSLSNTIRNLTVSGIALTDLPDGFWCVTDSIKLDGVSNFEFFPDLKAAGLPETPLRVYILNSSVQALPRTITRRKIEVLDLTGSSQIKSLPSNLAAQIKDGTIKTLNLTGTSVWPVYQRNLVLTEEVRSLFGDYDPQKPHELFDHRSSVVTQIPQNPSTSVCCNRTLCLTYTLILVLGITIPLGLLFMVFEHYIWNKNRKTYTDKPLFWASYLTGSVLVSMGIHKSNVIAQSVPLGSFQKEVNFSSGDTILDVYALLTRQGRELLDEGVYDWDRLWIQIFEQKDTYSFSVPEPLIEFMTMFMGGLQGKFEGSLGKNFQRFIRYKGGMSYLAHLSNLPFYQLVQTLEQDSYRFPVILDAIQDMRSSIGKEGPQYHSIFLNLEQIIETDMRVPDPDPQIMRALFALIAAGYHIDLTLNWSYNNKPQPLAFDMIPLSSNLDRLSVSNATLNDVPEDVWQVRHELKFDTVSGLQYLPELPGDVPQLPLKLTLTNTTLDGLPLTLGRRTLMSLNLENSQFIRTLPYSVKTAILENRIQQIITAGTAIPSVEKIHVGDKLKQLLNESVFEADSTPELAANKQAGQSMPCADYQHPFCDECSYKKSLCCYLPSIDQALKTISTVSCITLGGLALWKLKAAHDHRKEGTASCLPLSPLQNLHSRNSYHAHESGQNQNGGFDFFKHSDFGHYANMLLGYVVQDVWMYESLQTFLESLSGMDTGQNWNCYELLYNISTRRLEFIEDASCRRPRCRILPDSVVIRYVPGCLCTNMISALQGQVLNCLLKDEVIFHLNLFETHVSLSDGTTINLRKQMVILMYALGYTTPGQQPEDLYTARSSVCFVRRPC